VVVIPRSVTYYFPGDARAISAKAVDSAGATIPGISIEWTVRDTAIARRDRDGKVRVRRAGSTWLVAAAFGAADSIAVAFSTARPVWRFLVYAAFLSGSDVSVEPSDSIPARVYRQVDALNAGFNQAAFDGHVYWELARIVPPGEPDPGPPPGWYRILYHPGGGGPAEWRASDLTALMATSWPDGVLGARAARELIHEFGHARGALDLYAQEVIDPAQNPVTGRTWIPPHGIMTDLTGGWEPYSRFVINRNADAPGSGASPGIDEFPDQLIIQVRDAAGQPAPGTPVSLYPVAWRSWRVDPTPQLTGVTDAAGALRATGDVLKQGWANLHVVAVLASGDTALGWLPVAETQLSYLLHPLDPYLLTIQATPYPTRAF
jgi:hypothetical protein